MGTVVRHLILYAGDFQPKRRIYRNRRLAILSFYQGDKLVGRITIHRAAFQLIQRTGNRLRPDNLARRRHQRRQAGIHPYLRNERHRLLQQVDLPQLLQLGNHICVHTSRDLRFFHQLVRLGEIKILLDRTAIKQQIVLLIFPSGLDGIVEEAVDLGGETILYGIKGPREFLSGIERGKFLADRQ